MESMTLEPQEELLIRLQRGLSMAYIREIHVEQKSDGTIDGVVQIVAKNTDVEIDLVRSFIAQALEMSVSDTFRKDILVFPMKGP
ncbi:MAG: hypothetical protein PHY14_00065 [Candidatus Gracilibacteria bacterium]|nr:hypothetical protein [Candidatus Gracilibacteria bacterium]